MLVSTTLLLEAVHTPKLESLIALLLRENLWQFGLSRQYFNDSLGRSFPFSSLCFSHACTPGFIGSQRLSVIAYLGNDGLS